MAIMVECPFCHGKRSLKKKRCECGANLDKLKAARKAKYHICYWLPGRRLKWEPVQGEGIDPYSIEDAREGPRGRLERGERFERIRDAIDSLPERYRLPVILRYLQELSYEEISVFTGESRDEIHGILQRAGRQLRDLLADLEAEEGAASGIV